ncbi:MAG TPA: DUF167 family protein [Fibrobacteria bacterium]|jgi:uncharacterized protein (TIGR00251 family)|nr:DUF167 family protein [Fibrobacteria bacterium]
MGAGSVNAGVHVELAAAVRERDGDSLVAVRVTPRASATGLLGAAAGRVRIRLQAPPVEGAANAALEAFLAALCDVPKSSVRVERGAAGREKTVRISGVPEAVTLAKLTEAFS